MASFMDPLRAQIAADIERYSAPQQPRVKQNASALGDFGTALKAGVGDLPGTLAGVADMVNPMTRFGGPSATQGATALGEWSGIQPGKWAEAQRAEYSPEQQQYRQGLEQTKGFLPVLGYHAANPLQSAVHLTESLPAMLLPGGVMRTAGAKLGLGATGRMLGARAGEGVMMGGAQTQQLVDQGVDPGVASNAGLATGVLGAGAALVGGRIADRFGLNDIDTVLAGGRAVRQGAAAPRTFRQGAGALAGRVAGGAAAEGIFEEMPQSVLEQGVSNYAQGRPWDEGVAEASATGLALGSIAGGAMNIPGARRVIDATQDTPANTGATPAAGGDLFGDPAQTTPDAPAQPRAQDEILADYRRVADIARGAKNNPELRKQAAAELQRLSDEMKAAGVSRSAVSEAQASKRVAAIDKSLTKLDAQFEEALDTAPDKLDALGEQISALTAEREQLTQILGAPNSQAPAPGMTSTGTGNVNPELVRFGDQFKAAGGKNSNLREALNNAQSQDEVLDLVRTKAETAGTKNFAALDALHTQLTGQSLEAWKIAQDAAPELTQPQGVQDGNQTEPVQQAAAEGQTRTGENAPEGLPAQGQGAAEVGQGQPVREGPVSEQPEAVAQGVPAPAGAAAAPAVGAASELTPPPRPADTNPEARDAYVGQMRDYFQSAATAAGDNATRAMRAVFDAYKANEDIGAAVTAGKQGLVEQFVASTGRQPNRVDMRNIDQQVARLHKQLVANAEDPTGSSLRVAARELGVSHESVRNWLNKGLSAVSAAAERAGVDADVAYELLGLNRDGAVEYINTLSEAEAAQMGLTYRRRGPRTSASAAESDEFDDTYGMERAEELGASVDAASGEVRADENAALADTAERIGENERTDDETVADETIDFDQIEAAERAARGQGFQSERDHTGAPIRAVDVAEAAEDWDADVSPALGESTFAELPRDVQLQWVKAWIAHTDGAMNARTLAGVFERITNEYKARRDAAATQRAAQEGQAVERLQTGVPRAGARGLPEAATQAGAEREGQDEDGLTPDEMAQQWDAAARDADLPAFARLNAEHRNYILGSANWDEFNEAANEVAAELATADTTGTITADQAGFDVSSNPVEARVSRLRPQLGEKQSARLDKLIGRYTAGEIELERFDTELEELEAKAAQGFKYSEGGESGSNADTIRSRLRGYFLSPMRFDALVQVVQSPDELPADARGAMSAATGRVQGMVVGRRIYLIGDHIAEGQELAVLLHELGVHMGLKGLLGDTNFKRLVQQVRAWAGQDSLEGRLAAKALERAGKSSSQSDEEVVAYFVEEAVTAGIDPTAVTQGSHGFRQWFRTLWAAAKAALRKIGWKRFDQLTAQNVVDLAYGAAQLELSGTWHGTAAQFRRFDHSYMNTGEGAQAFGWGTYLAQRAGIAKGYFEADVRRKNFDRANPAFERLRDALKADDLLGFDSMREAVRALNTHPDWQQRWPDHSDELAEAFRAYRAAHDDPGPDGAMMRVVPQVEEDELLDWDKPLAEQSENVKAALNLKFNEGFEFEGGTEPDTYAVDVAERYATAIEPDTMLGRDLYQLVESHHDSDKAASEYLDSIGVKGIKFLDAQSRGSADNQTRNLVIFNDKNLLRVASQIAADRDRVQFSEAAPVMTSLKDRALDALVNPAGFAKQHGLGWLTLEQMADVVKSDAVTAYHRVMVSMQKHSKDRIHDATLIDVDWAKLPANDQERLSAVMREATRASFDPSTDEAKTAYEEGLARKYDGLPAAAKSIYTRTRDYYAKNFEDRKAIMLDAAHKANADGRSTKEVEKLFSKVKGPYFPLMRIGQWYSVGMSPELAALQAKKDAGTASAAEEKQLAKLRKQGEHYVTRGHTSRLEAMRSARELQTKLGVGYHNKAEEQIARELSSIPDIAVIEDYLGKGLPSDARAHVKGMLAQMYFDLLPEHSALKRQMKREGVHGEEEDMRRVFAASSLSAAHHISRMKYSTDLSEALQKVKREGSGAHEMMRLVGNELAKRTSLAMEQENNPLVDRVLQVSYFSHLGLSPAFILTNMSQVPMITAPWLGARHGYTKTISALAAAYVDTTKMIRSTYAGKGAKDGWRSEFNWASLFPAGSNEDKLFTELLDRNLLDITMEHDLGAVAEMRNGKLDDAIKIANLPVQVTERANRAVTGLAAYRLAMSKPGTTHTQAVDHAAKALSETQLNYSGLNAARHMQSVLGSKALARLMMQFRKYQQGMVYLVVKNAYDALKDADPATRKVARRTLFGLFATTGLMAGTVGVPFFGTLAMLANLIGKGLDDDDEPFDAEVEYRQFLSDMLGPEAAAAVAKGLPTLVGLDLSRRLGMGDIGSPLPFARQGRTGTETVGNALVAASGASFGTIASTFDGVGLMADGEWLRGAEKIAPIKAAQNMLRGYRYGDEGLTTAKGEVVVPAEKFSAWELALRSAGFQPMRESEYYAANEAVEGAKQAASEVRTKLLRDYAQARLRGDATTDIEADIADYNSRHPEKGLRIDASSKLRAVQSRRKMASERNDVGVRLDRTGKRFAEEGRFAAP